MQRVAPLYVHALRSLPSETFCIFCDSHLLSLLIPYPIQAILRRFQKRFLLYLRWKMERERVIQKMLSDAQLEKMLQPNNLIRFSVSNNTFISGYRSLRPGDHIVVFMGKFYHHGIYLGDDNVADVNRGRQRALDVVHFDKFLAGQRSFGVVHYDLPLGQDIDEFHRGTIAIVQYMLNQNKLFQTYRLLTENCECFAICCITRGFLCESEQIQKTLGLIVNDPQFRRDFVDFFLMGFEMFSVLVSYRNS
jgi:Lecithin retinol acyltransferase